METGTNRGLCLDYIMKRDDYTKSLEALREVAEPLYERWLKAVTPQGVYYAGKIKFTGICMDNKSLLFKGTYGDIETIPVEALYNEAEFIEKERAKRNEEILTFKQKVEQEERAKLAELKQKYETDAQPQPFTLINGC